MGTSIWMHLTYISLYNHVQTKIDKYLIDPIWDDWPFSSSFKLPLYYYYCCDFFLGFKVKWTAETRRKQIPSYPIKFYPKKLVPKVLHSHLFTIFPLFFFLRFRHFAGFRATPKLVFCRLRSSIICIKQTWGWFLCFISQLDLHTIGQEHERKASYLIKYWTSVYFLYIISTCTRCQSMMRRSTPPSTQKETKKSWTKQV